jgi:hypothetical protein
MNDHIDDGGTGRLDDGQEDLFDLHEPEECDEIDKTSSRCGPLQTAKAAKQEISVGRTPRKGQR